MEMGDFHDMLVGSELGSITISIKEIVEEIFLVKEIRKFAVKNLSLEFWRWTIVRELVYLFLNTRNGVGQGIDEVFEHIKLSIYYFSLLGSNFVQVLGF